MIQKTRTITRKTSTATGNKNDNPDNKQDHQKNENDNPDNKYDRQEENKNDNLYCKTQAKWLQII